MKISISIFLLLFYFLTTNTQEGLAGMFGPKNYNECVLEKMKGVTSDYAARVIQKACFDEFCKSIEIPEKAFKEITGTAWVKGQNELALKLHNGNREWTIRTVTILCNIKKGDNSKTDAWGDVIDKYKYGEREPLSVNVNIDPISDTETSLNISLIEKGDIVDWEIVAASGYKN